ncbi:DUF7282 domain-containing protein [Halalkalicoccus jeotgali]|uniref:DUF7282 domain-containing protein n=1 Tax=Halalkalicoccus jeotgali (strain DSM 18796 / CECT 7217 / JCM 14584 / KCTC 4019 / B3) TaxID=795797 RepID=D8J7U3_HALJB|nr:hypothetical protein [Halalkalicoccus jeotgali]ADJ16113.1 hypothetical protein HacjB3_13660 [Halalkalicoccus jeotgali B3]ELY38207.1 hypothetical protein C497_08864 [Halalkalicoccus jeotgali B3]
MRRTDHNAADVSRRTVIRTGTAGLLALGGVGTVSAQDDGDEEESEADGSDEGAEPTADVTFSDQTVADNDDAPTVTVDRLEMNEGGYQSIHQYSRFQFADGEDPDEYDVPVPDELENPICESLIGITEYLEPGVYEDFEVPLFREDSPAVELGAAEVGPLEESQVMIAIPHHNTTDEDTFNCPDDPSTPDLFEDPEAVDGAFQNGDRDVEDIGVSHDLATVLVESDDEEQKETAERQTELVREGVLVPQPIGPDSEEQEEADEGDEEQQEDEDEENDDEKEQESDDEKEEEREDEERDDERDGKGNDDDDDDDDDDDGEKSDGDDDGNDENGDDDRKDRDDEDSS